MNMEIINKIETQISELENRLKKNKETIRDIDDSKKTLKSESNAIAGALQAFKGVLAEINASKIASEKTEAPLVNGDKEPSEKKKAK